ncbi:hypothetical protein SARC_08659 [Sphaeroforma arctica JP610]|uniref:C3H1-type domain-containing protein n=1 Tax=Sphaeroforma arctica JP610 TaxID=667725 RepID=A0A0L0FQ41_9EUKA|nr:hypothetical protein SARC_08659 [Sphaeroforma arctica JP610]KNC78925.1 hypothetical protein SARC_08659 [Sphaeroforma arctica JP610]|eukprot:XP_014152827.1 hypothetical protein SARC_08659 [Sphaeroforma arctica JP610]
MPPKKSKNETSKVKQQAADKTFGLKNKKGKKQQEFVNTVNKNARHQLGETDQSIAAAKKKKAALAAEKAEMELLFKGVVTKKDKEAMQADPKTVVCAFFKQGLCTKGAKCKFSHDMAVQRKVTKREVYESKDKEEGDEDWNMDSLNEAIDKKFGKSNTNNATAIICKYFIDALENDKYGWFWDCPNGTDCKYRHALPPGFVLKKDQVKDTEEDVMTLEDIVDRERQALGPNKTPVTLETFTKWKAKKRKEEKAAQSKKDKKRMNEVKAGRQAGITGKELLSYRPELFQDDDEAGGAEDYAQEEVAVDEEVFKNLDDLDLSSDDSDDDE